MPVDIVAKKAANSRKATYIIGVTHIRTVISASFAIPPAELAFVSMGLMRSRVAVS